MDIKCGLENEAFKYVYGVHHSFGLPFDENREIDITCAKNDYAAVQLLLYSEHEMLVSVNDEPCFFERGPIDTVRVKVEVPGIDKKDISVHLVGLIEDDDRQLKADILLDQPVIHVDPKRVQPVWIEIKIGKNMGIGTLRPEISVLGHRLFEDEKVLRTLTYCVNVVDVVLKDPAECGFYLDLWQHNSNIARKYDVELWSDRHFDILEDYVASLAELGQKAASVIVSEIPWSGQYSLADRIYPSNLFEYSMVSVRLTGDGRWEYDFSAMNRYISLCMKNGIKEEIEVFGLINIWLIENAGYGRVIDDYSDGIRIRYFDEKTGLYKYIRTKNELELYVKALEKNFIDKGWIEKVRVVADEPADVDLYRERLNTIRKMAPSFKFKAAINHVSFIEQNIEGILDYVPILPCVLEEFERLEEIRSSVPGKIAYYVCCWPDIPNTFISSPLTEARLIPWLAFYMELDGFLRWNYTVWPNNPLERISYKYPDWKAGDTNFVYPGKSGKPMLTLRYKALKKGIRDFEIFRQHAELKGGMQATRDIISRLFYWKDLRELHPGAKKNRHELYSLSHEDYEGVVGGILLELAGK